ncbi:MAG: iron hydrogenase small subunit [Lachnospiraceae bacterium]|nr:iron hydrogenase small subunit [Lachnospiraceae bacterium]
MVNMMINKIPVEVPEGLTILEAAERAGISIPHLCYLKEINEIGACRLCSVEIEGEKELIPACITHVAEGMKVTTNSSRVRRACRTNLALIMSQHDGYCSSCVRSGTCQLQKLANDFDLLDNPYEKELPAGKLAWWDQDFPLIRDASKCIKCMRCIQVCDKVQSMKVWDLMATGGRTRVDVAGNISISEADCALCGQCITHCPTGALMARSDIERVQNAIDDPDTITIVQIAPAVRTAWGESLGLPPEKATVNLMASALRELGFDYVFDTSFTADLTIMEEGYEFLHRLQSGDMEKYPMFTSCCPGWVRFLKSKYPELTSRLSTAKSPQQMFGAVIKNPFAERIGVPRTKICSVSIMPCSAKKAECALPTMRDENGNPDVDYVLTTREVVRMMKKGSVNVETLSESPFDPVMGDYTGAGVIFGATGGVMEAALRTAAFVLNGEKPPVDAFKAVRAEGQEDKPWREAVFEAGGAKVRVAVTSGLANADALCSAILRGDVKYDFVEVMACPGGCSGGGGQPILGDDVERALTRGEVLYNIDRNMEIRYSHENKDVMKLYEEYLGKPNSEKSEELLHTDHFGWNMPGQSRA